MNAKPFIKWVGGKGQLIGQLDALLPADFENWEDITYIDPFVGGGAMFFYMMTQYPNIRRAVINDINQDLVTCYKTIRDDVEELIASLSDYAQRYFAATDDERKDFYLNARARYNEKNLNPVENTTLFIFLNRTCFNGLYRVNKKGLFNVPCGRYVHPAICNAALLRQDSKLLQTTEIISGDFERTLSYASGNTFFYFDPPYRPLTATSCFTDYTQESFDDSDQIRLKEYCDRLNAAGFKFMLSNSDGKGNNIDDVFFDELYAAYRIERVWATRNINVHPDKRGKLTEIVVRNYAKTKGNVSLGRIFTGRLSLFD